jgi:precorrin-6A/cobalt-precorrin-6A reductase
MRLLILGGTTEASLLARRISLRADLQPVLSLAGRTREPTLPPIPHRIGGFGGVSGLTEFLVGNRIDAVIDATHPFAAQMSANAATACHDLGVPLVLFTRPPWRRQDGDRWTLVASMAQAVLALGDTPRRVLLTVGGLQLTAFAAAPQHHYVVRTIEPPTAITELPDHYLLLARGPFGVEDETTLMRDARIDVLVTKNSGGRATEAKLVAARACGIEVIMIERPKPGDVPAIETIDDMLAWIEDHRAAP